VKPEIREILAKSVLTRTGIPGFEYCINPYTGCSHSCRYCYATFMQRFSGHTGPWGSFVDVRVNAAEVLRRQLKRARRGAIILSSVTDPYQPAEAEYHITRKCLEVIELFKLPVNILTKSPLVLRDINVISRLDEVSVGITITTDDDNIRRIFEPEAPPVSARIQTLKKLHMSGISTYVFIGPLLPMNPESLAGAVGPYADSILVDTMNYRAKTRNLYRQHKLDQWLNGEYLSVIKSRLITSFKGIAVKVCES
jgi:DNA repair photolyase